ncbi:MULTISPECIES: hypothetical protein [Gammaproteobacteria]|uniref:Uncharacterized protein n=1 Tax=Umboniibacter marinipuniceus TaxID=569599 RepID=A0A3M0AIT5_9GAMM|nr:MULTISPECIES: hypothetical protein [Gammaproteobacteria]MBR8844288.1 hypothetical protein [Pseudoalteromonas sp. JC3]RMA82628.1 hypothetical protein DFR27_0579 [Umboniibacter marinipuniceus]WJE10928.1 hypothetical protein QSH61_22855 [Pseudoalteromonas sp. JC3]
MNQVINFIVKIFNNDISDRELQLKNDREYVIQFATSIKKARKDIQVRDYSVSREEQLTSKSSGLAKASR